MTTYNQCTLVREIPAGPRELLSGITEDAILSERAIVTQVSWIPTKFAVLNSVLKLREPGGKWEDGWKVTFVGEPRIKELLPDIHKAIRAHRKATGDSLPRPG